MQTASVEALKALRQGGSVCSIRLAAEAVLQLSRWIEPSTRVRSEPHCSRRPAKSPHDGFCH